MMEYRAVIKFLTKESNPPVEIHRRMVAVYGDLCPSYDTIRRWSAAVRTGHESLQDEHRSGRPSTLITDDVVDAVEDMIEVDKRITVDQIAHELGISHGTVSFIINDQLGMHKQIARWVPKLLAEHEKRTRWRMAREFLRKFESTWSEFKARFVTGDETWIYYQSTDSAHSAREWRHHGEEPPKVAKLTPTPTKVMVTFFWDSKGVLLVDYLPHGQTMNGEYYAGLIKKNYELR